MSAPSAAFERPRSGLANTVFKSGPLFISSKGLGWKSWKKRWFILTRTSLVFFKNDPSALPQKGGEVNLTLGGIDLNNSGRVVVREDKKLLTVLFPDGRDGRAFTLKAETSEDLYEWKSALEQALAQSPYAALVMGHNGIFRTNANNAVEGPFPQWRDNRPVKSLVVGRPILLALEDIDGGPSFLEKALRFLEIFGNNVEGILRLCANVEEVEHRIQEYEQGKNEFGPDEDAHVVGDCVKHVLRELPSSPVPASCCTALLDAHKMDKEAQINAMRSAILDIFPEPNRRLLQRILKMMHTIASYSSENRMTASAVATCMAPLLLRPLLAGECELDDDFDTNADNSAQLLAAANAANSAAGIVTTLLEEYESIFGDDTRQRCSISADSRLENSMSDDSTVDEDPICKHNGYHDAENEGGQDTDGDSERVLSGKLSETSDYTGSDLYDYKVSALSVDEYEESTGVNSASPAISKPLLDSPKLRKSTSELNGQINQTTKMSGNLSNCNAIETPMTPSESYRSMGDILSSMDPGPPLLASPAESCAQKPSSKLVGSSLNVKRSTFWGRSSVRKTLSMESVDSSGEEELAIQRLEITKSDLRHRIAKEARGNAILQASLERRKQALHERRMALEQDVQRLQEQLQAERDLRAALEVGLSMSSGQLSSSRGMDSKTRAELEEIALAEADVARLKQKVSELHHQLNQQEQHQFGSLSDMYDRRSLQQDFDSTLALCNHERKQRHEEGFLGQVLAAGSHNRQSSRKQYMDPTSLRGSKSPDAFSSMPMDDMRGVYSTSMPSTSRLAQFMDFPRHPTAASSTLVELTTRLDFFKERRSQLMEQLHNLDINYGAVSQDFMYRPASPSWS